MGERLLDTLNVRNPRLTHVETVSCLLYTSDAADE